jgi:gas vesicle protein
MTEEIIIQDKRTNPFRLFFAFLIGGLVGTGIAFLLAPQSGQQTRQMIKDKSLEMKDKAEAKVERTANDLTQQAKMKAESLKNRGQEILDEQRSKVESKAKQM